MIVVATDAPLSAGTWSDWRPGRFMGLARTGSSQGMAPATTCWPSPPTRGCEWRPAPDPGVQDLPNDRMSGLFQAVVESTEEAILNSLFGPPR